MKNFIFKAALCFVALGFLACDAAGGSAPIEVQYMEKDNYFINERKDYERL